MYRSGHEGNEYLLMLCALDILFIYREENLQKRIQFACTLK